MLIRQYLKLCAGVCVYIRSLGTAALPDCLSVNHTELGLWMPQRPHLNTLRERETTVCVHKKMLETHTLSTVFDRSSGETVTVESSPPCAHNTTLHQHALK